MFKQFNQVFLIIKGNFDKFLLFIILILLFSFHFVALDTKLINFCMFLNLII